MKYGINLKDLRHFVCKIAHRKCIYHAWIYFLCKLGNNKNDIELFRFGSFWFSLIVMSGPDPFFFIFHYINKGLKKGKCSLEHPLLNIDIKVLHINQTDLFRI